MFYYKHGIGTIKDLSYIRNKAIIDAGAFIGDSALVLSDYTKDKIYGFEVDPENYKLFQKTIDLNHLTNVIPVNKALYCKDAV